MYSDQANHLVPSKFPLILEDSTGWIAEGFPLPCDFILIGLYCANYSASKDCTKMNFGPFIFCINLVFTSVVLDSKDTL